MYDGANEQSQLLGSYCGDFPEDNPGIINSSGNSMMVHFKSDANFPYKGFQAEYHSSGQ